MWVRIRTRRDAHVGPDALVWAAGRQPGGRWLRNASQVGNVIIPVCVPSNTTPLPDDNSLSRAALGWADGASAPTRKPIPPVKPKVLSLQESGPESFLSRIQSGDNAKLARVGGAVAGGVCGVGCGSTAECSCHHLRQRSSRRSRLPGESPDSAGSPQGLRAWHEATEGEAAR